MKSKMMKSILLFVVLSLSFVTLFAENCSPDFQKSIHENILENFSQDTKQLFKVWHFIFNKDYDYNTVEGINKYKTFKKNVEEIKQHNASGSSYRMGLNHLSDMTNDKIRSYYNIRDIDIGKLRKELRGLNKFNLDDYNEEIEENHTVREKTASNWEEAMMPVRNQGSCGSCWAFATQSTMEGVYNIQNTQRSTDYFSTQQLVDCDQGNKGCNGGWYTSAFRYFETNGVMLEKDYPYIAKQASCSYDNGKSTKITVKGGTTGYNERQDRAIFDGLLEKGPVAVAVAVNDAWYKYSTGIFNENCTPQINHAVTLIGYVLKGKCSPAHYIIRNSWGERWGEKGHIRIIDDDSNNRSCNIGRFGYQPKEVNSK